MDEIAEDYDALDEIDEGAEEQDESSEEEDGEDHASDADETPTTIKREFIIKHSNTPVRIYVRQPHEWTTSDVVTRNEAALVIAMRATMIDKTGTYFIETDLTDAVAIAFAEYDARRVPLFIRRDVGIINGVLHVEIRDPNKMIHHPIGKPPVLS